MTSHRPKSSRPLQDGLIQQGRRFQGSAGPASSKDALSPELVRIIEALAEAQARKEYAEQFPTSEAPPR
jgi:hypothetical protein